MIPPRVLGPCTHSGPDGLCPNRATAGHGRCERHARQERQRFDRERGTATQRGYGAEWRRIRAAVLAQQPYCAEPGCAQLSTDVDHEPRYVPGTDHRA